MSISNYKNIFYPTKNNSHVVRALVHDNVWEQKIVNIFKKNINKNDVVVDIGSYIGLHTIGMSTLAKKVISFEPQPLISACVRKTLNAKEIKNVEHYNIALGNHTGWTYIETNGDGDASIKGIREKKIFNKSLRCKIDKLDNIIKEKVSLIKIDVEGYEWLVLSGAILTIQLYKPIIILETRRSKKNMKQLEEFCEVMEYSSSYISSDNFLLMPFF